MKFVVLSFDIYMKITKYTYSVLINSEITSAIDFSVFTPLHYSHAMKHTAIPPQAQMVQTPNQESVLNLYQGSLWLTHDIITRQHVITGSSRCSAAAVGSFIK
jgi:hypothetical protein